jgi:hypothetical protein
MFRYLPPLLPDVGIMEVAGLGPIIADSAWAKMLFMHLLSHGL